MFLTFRHLEIAVAPANVGRMIYESFEDITLRHKVIPVSWPVTFKPPSKLAVLELHLLHSLLYSDNPPVLFRKLTTAEWAASEKDIANGTSPYLVPPFLGNALHVPTPLLLNGPSNPADPTSSAPPGNAPCDDVNTPGSDVPSAPNTQGDDTVSPSPTSTDPNAIPPVPGPGPRGGHVVSFNDKPKKAAKTGKKRKTAAEREAENKAKAIQKAAQKAAKAAEKQAEAAAKKAEAAAKKAKAAAKKTSKKGGKKAGKKAGKKVVSGVATEGSSSV